MFSLSISALTLTPLEGRQVHMNPLLSNSWPPWQEAFIFWGNGGMLSCRLWALSKASSWWPLTSASLSDATNLLSQILFSASLSVKLYLSPFASIHFFPKKSEVLGSLYLKAVWRCFPVLFWFSPPSQGKALRLFHLKTRSLKPSPGLLRRPSTLTLTPWFPFRFSSLSSEVLVLLSYVLYLVQCCQGWASLFTAAAAEQSVHSDLLHLYIYISWS